MYYEPDRLIVGGTPSNHRAIQWTSDAFGPDVDSVDPSNLTYDWTIDTTASAWMVKDGGENGTTKITVDGTHTTVHDHLSVTGEIQDVNIGDQAIRLSNFGSNNDRLEFRYTSTNADQIGFIDRYGSGDYDLVMMQGGVEETVLTTADDGTLDAATLNNQDHTYYAAISENETITGGWTFNSEISITKGTYGTDPADTISETTSPKSFTYTAGGSRDIHRSTDVTISNSSSSSATEDITVELYDGVDTTGTLLLSETQSISVASGASTTVTFNATDEQLDGGDYHINVTQSGTTLSVDQTDEHTRGATYTHGQTASGGYYFRNQYGNDIATVDPITADVNFASGTVSQQGNPLATEQWVAGQLVDAQNGGTLVAENLSAVDFGADLDVTDNGDGTVTVDFVGGGTSDDVYEDGTQVVTDAAYLEFLNHFNVTEGANGQAQAEVDTTVSDIADPTAAETVSGGWTFTSRIDVDQSNSQIQILGGGSGATDTTDPYLVEKTGDNFRVVYNDTSAGTYTPLISGTPSGDLDAPNGTISQQGNPVATQTWVQNTAKAADADLLDGNDSSYYAALSENESITGAWTFDSATTHNAGATIATDQSLDFGSEWSVWRGSTNGTLYVEETTDTNAAIARFTDSGVEMPQGATVGGNTVADQTWVGNNYPSYSENASISGSWSFGSSVSINSTLDINASNSHLTLYDSDTTTNDNWYLENENEQFNLTFWDDSAASSVPTITADTSQNVDVANGQLSEQGSRVATRTWATNNFVDAAGDSMSGHLVMGQNHVEFTGYEGGSYYLGRYSGDTETSGIKIETGTNPTSGNPIFIVESSGGSERLRVEHNGVTDTSNTLHEQGNRVATRNWTNNKLSGYDIVKNGTDGTGVINFKT